ncbi:MAG: hypothetical protein IT435_12090 [Phycisphaerales bacterium]|nr:hypothetical protein [Phycisphaerales bacterium]
MSRDAFAERGQSFEEGYFRQKDAEMVDKLRKVFEANRDREELRKTAGIQSEEVLDRLIKLSVRGEMLGAFKLFPLVEIAWADGKVEKDEAEAVVAAAIKQGMPAQGEAIARLRQWLSDGPTQDGKAAWRMFARELRQSLSKAELDTFRGDLMAYAKKVAEATGGVFGFLSRVSASEQRVLDDVKRELGG